MEQDGICQELIALADNEQKKVESVLPNDERRSLLFIETVRLMDHFNVGNPDPDSDLHVPQRLEIMRLGWNLASTYLFKPLQTNGFPLTASTQEFRNYAYVMLMQLGYSVLLRRVVDMIRSGMMSVQRNGTGFVFEKSADADIQFMDQQEFVTHQEMIDVINKNTSGNFSSWGVVEFKDLKEAFMREGNFVSSDKTNLDHFNLDNIDDLMGPLIRPWRSKHGLMIGYESTIDLDHHFLAKAMKLYEVWRDEAGLASSVQINGIDTLTLILVVVSMTSFHLKHIQFVGVANKTFPEISIAQNLTIWTLTDELIRDVSEFTNISEEQISKAFSAIILKPAEVEMLKKHTSRFMPLLIDMGNGFVIRPVSSVLRNPLLSIIAMQEYRDPNFRHELSAPREEWMRTHLYAAFSGVRYQNVPGNVRLRKGNKVITDIDAAVFDNLTGELALFQFKWQDFFFNDVKKLRSKAKNLVTELDEWADKTTKWLNEHDKDQLMAMLKLRPINGVTISTVKLFGISRNNARMKGYGYESKFDDIAIANWPQFHRIRLEVGPSAHVIGDIFNAIKIEANKTLTSRPLPTEIDIAGQIMNFIDLWSTLEEET